MSANKSGKSLENMIVGPLDAHGITYRRQVSLAARSIYRKRIRVDVLIDPEPRLPAGLIIEGKWQDVTGTAEEKLPYLIINIKRYYPYPTIIVIDGDGFSPGAVEWAGKQVDDENLIGVVTLKEWNSWCNREL